MSCISIHTDYIPIHVSPCIPFRHMSPIQGYPIRTQAHICTWVATDSPVYKYASLWDLYLYLQELSLPLCHLRTGKYYHVWVVCTWFCWLALPATCKVPEGVLGCSGAPTCALCDCLALYLLHKWTVLPCFCLRRSSGSMSPLDLCSEER